jgi:predicted hotdog family 3-hydroxylacyl-ACP dehydratase
MLTPESLCDLIPHASSMCLIETLLEWDEERILCSTTSHLRRDNPLRGPGHLSILHGVEYGAQAMALHGGLLARKTGETPAPGLLVSLRGVKLHRRRLDDSPFPLLISAHRLMADTGNLLYAFELTLNDAPVAAGRAAVIAQRK